MAYDAATNTTVLYGGFNDDSATKQQYPYTNDTWTYDGSAWTQRQAIGCSALVCPSWRQNAAMAYDPATQQVILYGGDTGRGIFTGSGSACDNSDASYYGDMWAWNGAQWSQLTPATSPGKRSGASIVFDAAMNRLLLIGGCDGYNDHNDTWSWDGSTWAKLSLASSPTPSEDGAAAYDASTDRVVLVNGNVNANKGGTSGGTWDFDGSNWTLANTQTGTGSMAYDAAAGLDVFVCCFGSSTSVWNDTTKQWANGCGTGPLASCPASEAPIVYEPQRGDVLDFDSISVDTMWVWGTSTTPPIAKAADRGAQGVYAAGSVVTYDITLGRPNVFNAKFPIDLADTLPSTLAPVAGTAAIGGAPCGATTTPACVWNGRTLQVTGVSLSLLETLDVTYQAIAVGLGRACSTVTNTVAATNLNGSTTASIPITVCDVGLGLEPWWSYVKRPAGPQAQAYVNAANGNLVLQQTDSTPVQGRGHLAFGVTRTYNSEDQEPLSFPGQIGANWVLNVAEVTDGVAGAVAPTGLYVPSIQSAADPTALTVIDGDGTRLVFQPRALSVTTDATLASGVLNAATRRALSRTPGYNTLSVDVMYDPPAGVHLGLWRYVESCVGSGCSAPAVVLGFAAERPDRLREEFSADGRLLDMEDASGNELRYVYETSPPTGIIFPRLLQVYEPRVCSLPLAPTCRSLTFSYPNAETITITDPAGRVTTYHLDTATPAHLASVDNPDGTHLYYIYGGCGGTANQMCSATDPRGNRTQFAYSSVVLGLPRVAALTDRGGSQTTLAYSSNDFSAYLTADEAGTRQRFTNIDDSGRVGEIDAGNTSDAYSTQTTYLWDSLSATCREPSAVVDNDLCEVIRHSLTSGPDDIVQYLYNEEGQKLTQTQVMGTRSNLVQTWGFHAQYIESNQATARTFDDTAAGNGQVLSQGPATGRTDAATLFAVSDRTQALSARGNAAGSAYAAYEDTYKVDDNANVDPNATPSGNTCMTPTSPSSNTGAVCEQDAPSTASAPTITQYTYDTYGERLTMTTPKAFAEDQPAPPQYAYTYYANTDLDLSGSLSAGGWLKAATDPRGNFVAFAYDRAGDVVRTWARNATQGLAPSAAISTFPSTYTQTLYSSLSSPWRYVTSVTDPIGDLTTYTLDANGNAIAQRPPRGNAAGTSTFDTTYAYDANDRALTKQLPAEASAGKRTAYSYDALGNVSSVSDPNGNVTVYQHDPVNRLTATLFTIGPWPSNPAFVPTSCRESSSSDAPIPAGRVLCSTTSAYDGVSNIIANQDGNHQTTTYTNDAAQRRLSQSVPRNDGTYATLLTQWAYDPDGDITDICQPNNGSAACTNTAASGTHYTFAPDDKPLTLATYRSGTSSPDTTTYAYDADGNRTSVTDPNGHVTTYAYDLDDRKVTMTQDQDSSNPQVTTTWLYDPSGNTTAELMPSAPGSSRIDAYSYDADNRMVDTVQGSSNATTAQAGTPGSSGGSNVRTRQLYDQDGNIVGVFQPGSFLTSVSSPDASSLTRTDYDADGRAVVQYQPRYGPAASDPGLGTTQTSQCPTGISAQESVAGVPAWPSGVGVCATRTSYDADGNPTQVTLPTSSGSDNRYLSYTYTDNHLLATVCAPNPSGGNTTCPGSTATPREVAISYVYDADGKVVLATDALGHTQITSYYADERVDQVANQPNGSLTHTTAYGYDANGNDVAVVDGSGNRTTSIYTTDNLLSSTTDGAGDATSYIYDPAGNPIGVASPSANARDANNNAGVPAVYTYTANNMLASVSIPVAATGNTARLTTYGYDAGGRKITETSSLVSSASPTQPVQACVPAANQCTSVGLPVPIAAGGAQRTLGFSYYNDDRLQTQSNSSTGDFITDQYDPAGQLTGSTTNNTATNLGASYYLDGSTRTVNDGKWTSEYAYDGAGAIAARAQVQNGTSSTYATTYTYGDSELPSAVASSTAGGTTSVSYDAAGRPSQETDPNGETLNWSFNPDDTLASLSLATSGNSSFATWSYTYDSNYRQLSQTLTGGGGAATGTFGYQYDGAGRLTSFSVPASSPYTSPYTKAITVNHDGDRVTFGNASFSYNADDSIATASDGASPVPHTFGFQYGVSGQLLSDGCATYGYDGFSRLTSYSPNTSTAGCSTTAAAASYSYDGLDRVRSGGGAPSIDYDGLSASQAVETSTAHGGYTGLYELSPNGQPLAITSQAAGSTQYLIDDGQGNVSDVMSSSQSAVCAVRYDAYGASIAGQSIANPCSNSGGSTTDTLFYRGERLDPASGNYTLGSRTYDPSTDQFLTPDSFRSGTPAFDLSIGVDPLTLDRYVAMNGDPVNLSDPTGHSFTTYDGGPTYTPCEIHGTCNSPPPNPCLNGGCSDGGGGNAGATAPGYQLPGAAGDAMTIAVGAGVVCLGTAEVPVVDVATCGGGGAIALGAGLVGSIIALVGLAADSASATSESHVSWPNQPPPLQMGLLNFVPALASAASSNADGNDVGGIAQRAEFGLTRPSAALPSAPPNVNVTYPDTAAPPWPASSPALPALQPPTSVPTPQSITPNLAIYGGNSISLTKGGSDSFDYDWDIRGNPDFGGRSIVGGPGGPRWQAPRWRFWLIVVGAAAAAGGGLEEALSSHSPPSSPRPSPTPSPSSRPSESPRPYGPFPPGASP